MAQATLNPAIEKLDKTTLLYDLYSRFYDGMSNANNSDGPDYITNPPYKKNADGSYQVDSEGIKIVDHEAIKLGLQEHSSVLMKNSAYMLANSIISTISPGGGGSGGGGTAGSGFVSRAGDTMQGMLGALYGFEAGYNNEKIFSTTIEGDNTKVAEVNGLLRVLGDATLVGRLNMANTGVWFNEVQTIWMNQSVLNIANPSIAMKGDISINGKITLGEVSIEPTGVFFKGQAFYHSGNSNKADVDWTMRDATISNQLNVLKNAIVSGDLASHGGFHFNLLDQPLIYSSIKEETIGGAMRKVPYVTINSDLSLTNGNGIRVDGVYVIRSNKTGEAISFSAPGKVMNLGGALTDGVGTQVNTRFIALQSDIKNHNGAYNIITHDGAGNFPNGFSAGAANGLNSVLRTYFNSNTDYGIISEKYLRLGSADGVSLHGNNGTLNGTLNFLDNVGGVAKRIEVNYSLSSQVSSSLIHNPTLQSSNTALQFDTGAVHFSFLKPIEAESFSIKNSKYKTQLKENVLFFDDGKFIEGLEDGLRFSQNSLFDGNLFSFNPGTSTPSFSSGFAGRGWAIMEDKSTGGIHATFDNLTIRKKMRIYELEVQKISVTNGSLWVSDSCSGDNVIEIK